MKKFISLFLIIYLFSTGASYAVFSQTSVGKTTNVSEIKAPEDTGTIASFSPFTIKPGEPKTEECPINGMMRTKTEKTWWSSHRPLGVMIENHEDARPQSGLSRADVVYEAVAEGGITRFLSIFYCQDAPFVGPVRSARTYFLDFLSPYADYPLYAHVGGANTPGPADAISQIGEYGWNQFNDLNQFSLGFPTYWRDYERLGRPVATEHTMYSTTTKLWNFAEKERTLTNVDEKGNSWDTSFVPFEFKEDAAGSGSVSPSYYFWSGMFKNEYSVKWKYDSTSNSYLRFNGSKEHIDLNSGKQLSTKNVVVLFMTEERANDGYEGNQHLLYGTIGKGDMIVFQDGKKVEGTWSKFDRESQFKFSDSTGKTIKFNRGQIWFSILPVGVDVSTE
jgi:hypothetical protein